MERIARSIPKSAAEIAVRSEDGTLPGLITVPRAPVGTVVFAHDSGSNRLKPRDQALAKALNDYGVATLLIDLITGKEHELEYLTRGVHFDVELQGERLVDAIDWIGAQGHVRDYFEAAEPILRAKRVVQRVAPPRAAVAV